MSVFKFVQLFCFDYFVKTKSFNCLYSSFKIFDHSGLSLCKIVYFIIIVIHLAPLLRCQFEMEML